MGLGWLDDAAAVLGTELSVRTVLAEGVRTTVARCWVDGSTTATGGARSVVAKCFRSKAMAHNSGGLGIVREVCGLASLPGGPALLAADLDLGVVVMSDLADPGPSPTLADLLTDTGPGADERALAAARAWGEATGAALTGSRQHLERFRALVRRAEPQTRSEGGPTSPMLPGRGALALAQVLSGRALSQDEEAEVARLGDLHRGGPDRDGVAVVSQADACPANVVFTPGGVRWCDFEATSWHHPALDMAQLVVPWVGCQVAAGLPDEFTEAAASGYRVDGPPVSDDDLHAAVCAAVLQETELSLAALRRRDSPARDGFATGRQRMVARWRWVTGHPGTTPALARLCEDAARTAVQRWGWPEGLPVAPCFSAHP